MKNEYSNSNWPEIKTGLKNGLVFLMAFTFIAFVGSTNHPGWILVVSPVTVGVAVLVAGKNIKWIISGMALALAFAILILKFGI